MKKHADIDDCEIVPEFVEIMHPFTQKMADSTRFAGKRKKSLQLDDNIRTELEKKGKVVGTKHVE